MTDVRLNVPAMDCDHCIMCVTSAAEGTGAEDVRVNLADKQVDVRYTDKNWNLLLFAAKMVINDLDIVDFGDYNTRMNPYRRGRVWR